MPIMEKPGSAPGWAERLPSNSKHRLLVAVDNNVLSNYLFEPVKDNVAYLFGDPRIQIQISRQVIDEALNNPVFDGAKRATAWKRLGELQENGKLFLSGTSQMTPGMLSAYKELAELLGKVRVSEEDARVIADAIVKRVPIFTLDDRLIRALRSAFLNREVHAWLAGHALPTNADAVLLT